MPPPLDVELQLRRHGDALRSLAAQLLRGPAIDDAMQEVWLTAMREPPRDGASVGGWLRTVLVHVASRFRRQRARRERHEARAARPDRVDDHAVVVAREEAGHRLLAAVGTLEPVYRDAIWQRFFEGKAPREIAASSGAPIATVKSRLQRGLGMLRARLAEKDDTDWRAGFAAAFGFGKEGTTAAAATTVAAGGVVMATWTKVTCGVLAGAAALAVWMAWPEANTPVSAPPLRTETAALASAASGGPATAAADTAPLADAVPERVAPPASPAANDAKLATIRGRCVDETGAPLAGCDVKVGGWEANSERTAAWLVDHAKIDWQDPLPRTTADDGTFVFSFVPLPPLQFRLEISREGVVPMMARWMSIDRSQAIDVGDVVMRQGVRLRGRVVDSAGQPLAKVPLSFDAVAQQRRIDVPIPRTNAGAYSNTDGSFATHDALLPGEWSVRAGGALFRLRGPQQLTLAADAEATHEIVVDAVPDDQLIRGKVVDDADAPVARAIVRAQAKGAPPSATVSTRADGTFVLVMSEGAKEKTVTLQAEAAGHEPAESARPVPWGSTGVVLRMTAGTGLQVRVTDGAGAAIESFSCRLERADGTRSGDPLVATGEHRGGIAKVPGVARGNYDVVVEFPAAASLPAIFDRVEITGAPQLLALRSVVARRSVRVATTGGDPVAGTRVQLCEMRETTFEQASVVATRDRWFAGSGPNRVFVLQDRATAADGRCELAGAPGRGYGVRVLGPGHSLLEIDGVQLDRADELIVIVASGGTLRGRIVPAAAVAEIARLVADATAAGFDAENAAPRVELRCGSRTFPCSGALDDDPTRVAARVRADGTFELPNVPAGEWRVEVSTTIVMKGQRGLAMGKSWRGGAAVVRDGATTDVQVDLSRVIASRLRGVVVWNGTFAANAKIGVMTEELDRVTGERTAGVYYEKETDAHGTFEYEGTADRVEVSLRSGLDQAALPCRLHATSAALLRPGESSEHTFHVASGILRLRVLDASGAAAVGVRAHLGEDQVTPPTAADGRVEFPCTAGTFALRALPKSLQSDDGRSRAAMDALRDRRVPFAGQWLDLGTVTVVAGDASSLELRLPAEFDK